MNADRVSYTQDLEYSGIAYEVRGSGPPLVWLDAPPSHLHLSWKLAEAAAFYQRLAECHTLIRFDMRGFGLSDRTGRDFSLDALLGELGTVVDALQLPRFALGAVAQATPVAITAAARMSNRVSHLVLCSGFAQGSAVNDSGFLRTLLRFPPDDWPLHLATLAQVAVGWPDLQTPDIEAVVASLAGSEPSLVARVARMFHGAVTPESWRRAQIGMTQLDARPSLGLVRAPTLLLYPRASRLLARDRPKQLASALPNAALRRTSGSATLPYLDDAEETARPILDHLQF